MIVQGEEFNGDGYKSNLMKEAERINSLYQIDRRTPKRFVNSVVEALLDYFGKDTLEEVKNADSVVKLHFTLGAWIRNVFIYAEEELPSLLTMFADDLSRKVLEELQNKLKEKVK